MRVLPTGGASWLPWRGQVEKQARPSIDTDRLRREYPLMSPCMSHEEVSYDRAVSSGFVVAGPVARGSWDMVKVTGSDGYEVPSTVSVNPGEKVVVRLGTDLSYDGERIHPDRRLPSVDVYPVRVTVFHT